MLTKNCVKIEKKLSENRYIHVEEQGATRILFNLCGSLGFYHRCQNQRNRVRLFISTLLAEKSAFSRCVIHNWEEIESLKIEKIVEKSWKSFPFRYEPCLNTMFSLLSVSCLVVELFCSHTHDRYANSMLYK